MKKSGFISGLGFTLTLLGCGENLNLGSSNLKIDRGTLIDLQSQNPAMAVFAIGGCSAQAVSHNTLLTAAHCVEGGGPVGIESGKFAGLSTHKVKSAKGYFTGFSEPNYAFDVALAVFPDNSFDEFFRVRDEEWQPQKGEEIWFVGYAGQQDNTRPKKWGKNSVLGISADQNVVSSAAKGVSVSPGDSGGLIVDELCNVLGVASRMTGTVPKRSLHARPNYPPTNAWIKDMEQEMGAYVCGITGLDPEKCPPQGFYYPSRGLAENEFSCLAPSSDFNKKQGQET